MISITVRNNWRNKPWIVKRVFEGPEVEYSFLCSLDSVPDWDQKEHLFDMESYARPDYSFFFTSDIKPKVFSVLFNSIQNKVLLSYDIYRYIGSKTEYILNIEGCSTKDISLVKLGLEPDVKIFEGDVVF